ncbi:hypothetical protein [Aquimarina macrocephali]|uniref:hypothetical protein n=1 Tax=Aquimarina macrocephali TaxID=666563 RepID=UPI0004638C58|nr:hypothetical protein [Aquimarina macrocephali]
MKKIVTLAIVISILSLIITILQDELRLNKELQYENKRSYPIGVNPTEHDALYEKEFEEDYKLYNEDLL